MALQASGLKYTSSSGATTPLGRAPRARIVVARSALRSGQLKWRTLRLAACAVGSVELVAADVLRFLDRVIGVSAVMVRSGAAVLPALVTPSRDF